MIIGMTNQLITIHRDHSQEKAIDLGMGSELYYITVSHIKNDWYFAFTAVLLLCFNQLLSI